MLVRPGSSRTEVGGSHAEALVVRVQAPATDGRANEAVVRALAEALGIPRRQVSIASGASSRHKVVALDGDAAVLVAAWERLRSG